MNVFTILLITSIFSISACSNQTQLTSSDNASQSSSSNGGVSSNKSDSPYTTVTLTEEGAARVNAGLKRQSTIRQRYAKYSSWLKPNFLNEATEDEVKAGDEVEEDMNFEIYPSDLAGLDKMFLIGRTKPSSSDQTKDSSNSLIEITTNISKEEISDYSLNGQISYINGSGNINHDTIQFDSIPYQESTEFTMTYTYIKKGTSADSSPYSCQPSFNITKIDNEAPKYENSHPYWEDSGLSNIAMSYTLQESRLRNSLAQKIGSYFTINDRGLTKTVTINKTDAELETLRQTAISGAKVASDHHFEPFTIPFTVSTQNASTEELTCTVLLIDDIKPAIFKDGVQVETLQLEGGTDLQLPHKDVVNSGANALLLDKGYVVEDYIEGVTTLDFDVYLGYNSYNPYYSYDSFFLGCLITEFSYDDVNREISDMSTKFNWEVLPCSPAESYRCYTREVAPCCFYTFDYETTSHTTKVMVDTSSESFDGTVRDSWNDGNNPYWRNYIIEDMLINPNNDYFEEMLLVNKVESAYYSNWDSPGGFVIINVPDIDVEWPDYCSWHYAEHMVGFNKYDYPDKVYYNVKSYSLDKKRYDCNRLPSSNVYTGASEYDKENLYYNETDEYEECFCFKVAKGTLKDINYNCSIEQFKAKFNLNY